MNEEALVDLMRDYAITFGSPAGQRVLADLEVFCHVLDPLEHADERRERKNEGRREVALRIMKFTKLTISDIWNLRKGHPVLRSSEGDAFDE